MYGFFNNGGNRCWVVRVEDPADLDNVRAGLEAFEKIDEITMVLVPGSQDTNIQNEVIDHCERMGDRFAILDGQRKPAQATLENIQGGTKKSNYAALYFPWIKVYDPVTKKDDVIAPSGHIAGVYARTDIERGVHKAPANVVIRGPKEVEVRLNKADQAGLNPKGINVIRQFDGNVTVWGARTLGGDDNLEFKYINVRRLFLMLRESIDEGTQWVVFEPNDKKLWDKIRQNITALPHQRLAQRRALRRHAGAGLLRQVRRRAQPEGGARPGPGHHRDRRRAGHTGRVRHLSDTAVDRPWRLIGVRKVRCAVSSGTEAEQIGSLSRSGDIPVKESDRLWPHTRLLVSTSQKCCRFLPRRCARVCPSSSGWCAESALNRAPSEEFDKAPLPGAGDALWVVRSTRVSDQIRGKTRQLRERRQRAAPDYFLADIPEPSEGADDTRNEDDAWAVHISHTERFNLWEEFEAAYRSLFDDGYLGHAMRGFFANDGRFCRLQMVSYRSPASPLDALREGLRRGGGSRRHRSRLRAGHHVAETAGRDRLRRGICLAERAPGPLRSVGGSIRHPGFAARRECRARLWNSEGNCTPNRKNGALYFPFVGFASTPGGQASVAASTRPTVTYVPPSGHVAGVYARTDERVGVFKAPANEVLKGVIDLERMLGDEELGELNQASINCLRSFPTRGIRVWGARTLSDEEEWRYVSVRRLFITAGRWIERNMMAETFEPHTPDLWARIRRDLSVYFNDLFQRGALHGDSAQEAYFVKCDEENNPEAVRDAGMIITEIGLATAAPAEFVVVRIIADVTGVTIEGPDE